MEVTLSPLHHHLPADCLTLRVAPMRLRLATKGLVSKVVKLLAMTCAPAARVALAQHVQVARRALPAMDAAVHYHLPGDCLTLRMAPMRLRLATWPRVQGREAPGHDVRFLL